MKPRLSNLLLVSVQTLLFKYLFLQRVVISAVPVRNTLTVKKTANNKPIIHNKQSIIQNSVNEYPVIHKKPKVLETKQSSENAPTPTSNQHSTSTLKDTLPDTKKPTPKPVSISLPLKRPRKSISFKPPYSHYKRIRKLKPVSCHQPSSKSYNNFKKLFLDPPTDYISLSSQKSEVNSPHSLIARIEYKLIPQKVPANYRFLRGIESMERVILPIIESDIAEQRLSTNKY